MFLSENSLKFWVIGPIISLTYRPVISVQTQPLSTFASNFNIHATEGSSKPFLFLPGISHTTRYSASTKKQPLASKIPHRFLRQFLLDLPRTIPELLSVFILIFNTNFFHMHSMFFGNAVLYVQFSVRLAA